MTAHLRGQGYRVNHKRIQRLMHKMGLCAIYPRRHTSTGGREHKIYPYLLRNEFIRAWGIEPQRRYILSMGNVNQKSTLVLPNFGPTFGVNLTP